PAAAIASFVTGPEGALFCNSPHTLGDVSVDDLQLPYCLLVGLILHGLTRFLSCARASLLHFWAYLIHEAAGGGNHCLCVAATDAQPNMLHPGVFVAFDGVDHLLGGTADGGRASGGIATVAKRDVVHPGRNGQAGGITSGLGTEPPQANGFLR